MQIEFNNSIEKRVQRMLSGYMLEHVSHVSLTKDEWRQLAEERALSAKPIADDWNHPDVFTVIDVNGTPVKVAPQREPAEVAVDAGA